MGVIMLGADEARRMRITRAERMLEEIERRIDAVAETRTSVCICDNDDKLGQVVTDMLSSSDTGLSVQIELSRNGYSLRYGDDDFTRYVEISWGK